MAGVFGILSTESPPNPSAALKAMAGVMAKDSFLRSGVVEQPGVGAWLGWSCHDKSFSAANPVWNETRDIGLVLAGEAFPEPAELEALRQKGHALASDDASYLVHAYEEKGIHFLEDINGWFSGVLLDLRNRKTLLFNDRYGFSRIYYRWNNSCLYFASEAKCLLAVLPKLRTLDQQALGEYLACGCALQNRSLFREISLLPGASAWFFPRNQKPQLRSYFRREQWESQPILNDADYETALVEKFRRVLPKYFRGNQSIAMSLTGGLDGRMVMAWADVQPGQLPCYTFGGPYRECADVRLGRRVAAACGQPHQVISVGEEFLRQFPSLAAKAIEVSDGLMDVTGAVELYVNHLAREIAPVRLTGNYGSEIVRSHVAFRPSSLAAGLLSNDLTSLLTRAVATYHAERNCDILTFIAFKQLPWFHYARFSVEHSELSVRSPYLDNDLVRLVYRAPQALRSDPGPSFRLIAAGRHNLARIPTDRGLVYPPRPFLTPMRRQWEEFLVKAEYAMDYGMPQSLAALAGPWLPRWVERLFLGRQKFYHFRTWYRRELAPYIKEVLLDSRTRSRPWLNPRFLEPMVMDHTSGRRNYTREIHKVLSLELLHRQFLD